MLKRSNQPRFFYGYVVTAAGFTIWLIGWGTFTPSFSVFFKPLLAEFGWSRAETSLAYSLSFMVLAIFGIMIGWLILVRGWRSAYGLLGIITFIGIIMGGVFLRRDPSDIGQLPDGVGGWMATEAKLQNSKIQGTGFSLREAIHTSQFWMIAGLYYSFGFCRSTFLAHIVAHVQDLGFSLTDGANVLAVIIGSSMFSRVGMGRVADKIGNRQAFMISFAATMVSLIWGLVAKDLWELYLFALVFGFGWGNQAVLRVGITSEVFGLASLGLVMGILGFAESGAATFGSFFAGYIFDVFGSYQLVFWAGIGVSIAGIILAWLLKPAIKRSD